MAATPPTLTHYQRLQGYARVVQNLVWNPDTGDIEMEAQAHGAIPQASSDASFVLTYTDNDLTAVTKTVGGTSWVKTLTYTDNDLTSVSGWVEL